MNIQMMEGLMDASASARLSDTSMRVYRQASAEGDTETMKRALGYSGECTGQAALERTSAGKRPQTDSVPAVYTPSGQTAPLLEPEPTVSCLA